MSRRTIIIVVSILVLALLGVGYLQYSQQQAAVNAPKKTPAPTPTPTPKPLSLLDYVDSDTATVLFTIDGPVKAKEVHLAQTIAVAKTQRTIDVFDNYSGTATNHLAFENNQAAFQDFLQALQTAGFLKTVDNPKATDSESGLCPLGQRFTYELIVDGATLFSDWSTSCKNPTNYAGVTTTIQTLFKAQIPDYSKVPYPK